jgi:hypothetical protein
MSPHRQLVLSHRHPLRRWPHRRDRRGLRAAGITKPLLVTDRGLKDMEITPARST